MSAARVAAALIAALTLSSCAPAPPANVEVPAGWVDEGPVLTLHDGAHDVARVGAITRALTDSGEVIVLRFDGGLGPTTAPAPSWLLLGRTRGVLRVICTLAPAPGISPSAWTDTSFAPGGLVSAAYVLRTLEGHVAVDLHLAGPVVARARVGPPDSALVIELRPGGGPMPAAAPESRRPHVVLLEPRAGQPFGPLAVEGYSRLFEGNTLVQVRGGGMSIDTFATAADHVHLWGEFRLELPQAAAAETVRVGEADMDTGALRMIEVVRSR